MIGRDVTHALAHDTYGTLGCYGRRGAAFFLVSCDHVLRARSSGPAWHVLSRRLGRPRASNARWTGDSLVSATRAVADLAAAQLLALPPEPADRLPGEVVLATGVDRLTGLAAPVEGAPVFVVGARTGLHVGEVASARTQERLPHPIFGPRAFELQFSILLRPSPQGGPLPGDSGAPVITEQGELIGFLGSEVRSCLAPAAAESVAYCIPASEGLARLGIELLL